MHSTWNRVIGSTSSLVVIVLSKFMLNLDAEDYK